jgi:hypothetical protein
MVPQEEKNTAQGVISLRSGESHGYKFQQRKSRHKLASLMR